MSKIIIQAYAGQQTDIKIFFKKVFKENNRHFDINGKDSDLNCIEDSYLYKGAFWIALNNKGTIIGTIALRPISDYYEIRRFFVLTRNQNRGVGSKLLNTAIEYAIDNAFKLLKAATLEEGTKAQNLFEKFNFAPTKRYNNSTADIFYKLNLDTKYKYDFKLAKLQQNFQNSLILNPTENIPMYGSAEETDYFEGLYISERFKDLNDKIIFAGRNEYISFFEYIKDEWKSMLGACDVDLKPLAGLNAHLILFLCVLQPNETIMLLPEICGGHFATEQILISLGANVIQMIPDTINMCVDIEKTKKLIQDKQPNYIFVDRSEGLIYEDFSWVKEYPNIYKIFDSSQYLTQIILNNYPSPFTMGFDMQISTLHKNYPGPQKGLLAVKQYDSVWDKYLSNAKTYISNTHPMAIAKSLMPIISNEFSEYSRQNILCNNLLESELKKQGVPIVERLKESPATLHIWILCPTKEESYRYYLKLEELNVLTNYRLLPYELGYGLRVGTSAAVRSGLRSEHVKSLASIMAQAYYGPITPKIQKQVKFLISSLKNNRVKFYNP